jgi:hypothetical protein
MKLNFRDIEPVDYVEHTLQGRLKFIRVLEAAMVLRSFCCGNILLPPNNDALWRPISASDADSLRLP